MTLFEVMVKYKEKYSGSDIFAIMEDYFLDSRLDRDVLNKKLLEALGRCDVWYEDCDIYKMYQDNLFEMISSNIEKLIDTVEVEYNPIQNTDITETSTISIDQDLNTESTSESSDEYTRSRDESGTDTSKISAFDSSDFQNESQRIDSSNDTISHEGSRNGSSNKDEALEWRETDTNRTVGYKDRDVQSAIEKERRLAKFNVYEWIVQKYKEELIVLVY